MILLLTAAIFWAGFEQAGSSLNLFGKDNTNLSLGNWLTQTTGFAYLPESLTRWANNTVAWLDAILVPASWFQSINPFFIIVLAPFYAWLWVWLQHRNPSIPLKFGIGLVLMALGFFIIGWAATYTTGDSDNPALVSPNWLIATYLLHTMGELCLSPVGLSSVSKLSPKPLVGQMMGLWFVGAALGNLISGLAGGMFDQLRENGQLHLLFWYIGAIGGGVGVVMIALVNPIKSLYGNIK